MHLREVVYGRDLGHVPADGLDDRSYHLIARTHGGEVIAAFRIVGPEHRPFDFEQFVPLDTIIAPGGVPALIGRLCVRPDYRPVGKGIYLQFGLLKLAWDFCAKNSITDLFLYTYDNLIEFYRGAFFELLEFSFNHPDWGGVRLMHLDLTSLRERCVNSRSRFARFLLAENDAQFLL